MTFSLQIRKFLSEKWRANKSFQRTRKKPRAAELKRSAVQKEGTDRGVARPVGAFRRHLRNDERFPRRLAFMAREETQYRNCHRDHLYCFWVSHGLRGRLLRKKRTVAASSKSSNGWDCLDVWRWNLRGHRVSLGS